MSHDSRRPSDAFGGRITDAYVSTSVDPSDILVVGRSQINRVVVAKIVERSGLRAASASPEHAADKLAASRPTLVILDGGPQNRDCDALVGKLIDRRRSTNGNVPRVILLSNKIGMPEGLVLGSPIDAVVAKPITPELLQPVIERLMAAAQS